MREQMIAHGVFCTWHDDKANVGVNGVLPCCPHCRGLLYEMPEAQWLSQMAKHNASNPGYAQLMVWSKGKCFPTFTALKDAYAQAGSP